MYGCWQIKNSAKTTPADSHDFLIEFLYSWNWSHLLTWSWTARPRKEEGSSSANDLSTGRVMITWLHFKTEGRNFLSTRILKVWNFSKCYVLFCVQYAFWVTTTNLQLTGLPEISGRFKFDKPNDLSIFNSTFWTFA